MVPPRSPEHALNKEHCLKETGALRHDIFVWIHARYEPLAILAAVALGEPLESVDPAKETIVQRLKEVLQCPCCSHHLNNGGAALNMAAVFDIFGSELEGYVTDQIQRMIGD